MPAVMPAKCEHLCQRHRSIFVVSSLYTFLLFLLPSCIAGLYHHYYALKKLSNGLQGLFLHPEVAAN